MKTTAWALKSPKGHFVTRGHLAFNDGLPTALFRTKRHALAALQDMVGYNLMATPVKVKVVITELNTGD